MVDVLSNNGPHTTNSVQKHQLSSLMIASLVIQGLLTFLAPLRKSKASEFLKTFLWLLYLLANSVALFGIGLIIRNLQLRQYNYTGFTHISTRMHVLWAPFLLLHLGGPDTITSLSLEDNQLWLRYALQLVTEVSTTLYVFGMYIYENKHFNQPLWVPMITFIYINGCIKYFERICALYYASRDGIRASQWGLEAPSNTTSRNYSHDNVNNEFAIVNHAYFLYEKLRPHIADDILILDEDLYNASQELLLNQPVQCVDVSLRIIEAELNIIYDIFHTKVFLSYHKRAFLRIVCFLLVLASSLLFFFAVQSDYKAGDPPATSVLRITLTLLVGAIFFDIASFVMFLFSDWCIIMVVKMLNDKPSNVLKSFLLLLQKWGMTRDSSAKRWCEMCPSYNLLDYSLKHNYISRTKLPNMAIMNRIKDFLTGWLLVGRKTIKSSCLKFIFNELQQKVMLAKGNKEATQQVCSARGELVFQHDNLLYYLSDSNSLNPWTVDIDYSKSLIIWHLATDLMYWTVEFSTHDDNNCEVNFRTLSKQLSDYMTYILLRHPKLVPQLVSKSDMQFESAKSDIIRKYAKLPQSKRKLTEFCKNVLQQQLEANERGSVLYESLRLVQKLMHIEPDKEKRWEKLSKVWVEMLCYAAIRSLPRYNFACLSKGGELITLVWLYMTQLGFLPQCLSN